MSTDTSPPTSMPPQSAERRILGIVNRTRRQIQVVDAIATLLWLGVFMLCSLIGFAVVDHVWGVAGWLRWVAAGGFWMVIVVAVAWQGVRLKRHVNPLYAAKVVEGARPGFQNSLINFLLMRQSEVRPAVLTRLQAEAEKDVREVAPTQAVDHSLMIKAGYAFALSGMVFLAYAILSPRSVVSSAQRMLLPTANVARPTSVLIEKIEPGDAAVRYGTSVDIRARIEGADAGTPVWLECNSDDGQFDKLRVSMVAEDGGDWYRANLPPTRQGFRQSMDYQVFAGDAVSRTYGLDVVESPTIAITRIVFEFPSYMNRAPEVVDVASDRRQASQEIVAPEGTQVVLFLAANYDIRSGYLEFDPDPQADETRLADRDRLKFRQKKSDPRTAQVRFVMRVNQDRESSEHARFWLRYITSDSATNAAPIVHRVNAIADRPPLIELLKPAGKEVPVPLNGSVEVEVRARDQDFGMTRVVLEMGRARQETQLELLETPSSGQVLKRLNIIPQDLQWSEGDVVTLQAIAWDNYHVPYSGEPSFQRSASRICQLRIVAPEEPTEADAGPRDQGSAEDPSGGDQAGGQDGTEGAGEASSGQGETGEQGEQGAEGGQGGDSTEGNDGDAESSESASDTSPQPVDGSAQQSDSGQSGSGQSEESNPSGSQNNDPSRSQASEPASEADGRQQGQQANNPPADQGGADESGPASREELPNDGSSDAELMERLREILDQENQAEQGDAGPSDAGQGQAGQRDEAQEPNQSDGESQPSSESQDRAGDSQSAGQSASKSSPTSKPEQGDPGQQDPGQQDPGQQDPGQQDPGQQDTGQQDTGQQDTGQPADQEADDGGNSGQRDPAGQKAQEGTSQVADSDAPSQDSASNDGAGGDSEGTGKPAPSPQSRSGDSGTDGSSKPGEDGSSSESPASGARSADGESADGPDASGGEDSQASTENSQRSSGRKPANADNSNPQNGQGQGEGDAADTPPAGSTGSSGDGQDSASDPSRDTPPAGDSQSDRAGNRQNGAANAPGDSSSGDQPGNPRDANSEEAKADQANLDYSQEVVDLVLESLQDQQQNPDPELLEKMQWTAGDLRRFLSRWQALKQRAAEGTDAQEARKDWKHALQSLGLQHPARARRDRRISDGMRDLRNQGRTNRLPAQYRELFRAYRESADSPK